MGLVRKPKELGYRFPAEWEAQEAVWFAWPTREDLWPGALERVRERLAELYVTAARYEPVRVLCPERAQGGVRERMLRAGDASAVSFYDYETDDVWCRDFGPLFLLGETGEDRCLTDWGFNAWGGKFPLYARDNGAPAWMAERLGIRRFVFHTVLEGGAVESNGRGQILTTEAVLLNPNRNPGMDADTVATKLMGGLGADELLWLGEGLFGDDTDGHIDNLARFFKADGILVAEAPDSDNANHERLSENMERIRGFRTPEGRPFASVQLPLPDAVPGAPSASYLNYLVLNGAVLVPTFGQPSRDAEALEIIGDCFPSREIVGFDCREIAREGGGPHCLSQNQPATGERNLDGGREP